MKLITSIFLLFFFCFSDSFAQVPVSVSVQTSSYTIPARKWARVVVNLEGAATFTINSVLALRGTQNSVLSSDNIGYFYNSNGGMSSLSVNGATLSSTAAGTAFTEGTEQSAVVHDYRLNAGTVINGTGVWRAVVELYER